MLLQGPPASAAAQEAGKEARPGQSDQHTTLGMRDAGTIHLDQGPASTQPQVGLSALLADLPLLGVFACPGHRQCGHQYSRGSSQQGAALVVSAAYRHQQSSVERRTGMIHTKVPLGEEL